MSDFDKKYRQRMAEHEVPVPPDFFNRIQKERKKQPVGGWFYRNRRCFLLMLGVGVLSWVVLHHSQAPLGSRDNDNIRSSVVPTLTPNATSSLTSTSAQRTNKNTQANLTTEVQNINNKAIKASPAPANLSRTCREGGENEMASNVLLNNRQQGKDKKINSHYGNLNNAISNFEIQKAKTIENQASKSESKLLDEATLTTQTATVVPIEGNVNIALSPTLSQTSKAEIALLPSLLPAALDNQKPLNVQKRLGDECFTFKKRKNSTFFVEGYLSPQYTDRSLSLYDSKEKSTYLALRQSLEKAYWSFDGGVNVGMEHHSGFNLKVGVNYQQINEIFSYKIADYTIKTYNPDGSLLGTSIGERYAKTYNRYRFVQVPLMLGYNFGANRRNPTWHFGLHTGVGLNLLTIHRGSLVPPNDLKDIASFTTGSADKSISPFKPTIGALLYADFTIYRQLTPNTSVFFAPKYTKLVQSITKSEFPINQNYSLFGLTVGIRTSPLPLQRRGDSGR